MEEYKAELIKEYLYISADISGEIPAKITETGK